MPATQNGALEKGDIHDVLRNDRRRLTLTVLQNEGTPVAVRDLAEAVATMETGENPAPRNKRQSVYVSLHQTHLPKLDTLGIISYNENAKTVELLEKAREVEVYMEIVPKYNLSWGEYYLTLAILGLLTTLATTLGVPLLADIGPAMAAIVFLGLVIVSAIYHIWTQQGGPPFARHF